MLRIYEFAKNVGLSSKEIIEILGSAGFPIKNHMVLLGEAELKVLDVYFANKSASKKVKVAKTGKINTNEQVILTKKVPENVKEKAISGLSTQSETKIDASGEKASALVKNNIGEKTIVGGKRSDENCLVSEVVTDIVAEPEELEDIDDLILPSESVEFDDLLDGTYSYGGDRTVLAVKVGKKVRIDAEDAALRRRRQKRQKGPREKDQNSLQEVAQEEKLLDLKKSYSVIEVAKLVGMAPTQMVGFFVKRGRFYSMNDLVPTHDLEAYAAEWGVTIKAIVHESPNCSKLGLIDNNVSQETLSTVTYTKRPPVVVIMGHVDHGKTTLIDYIRKTNVAAKEKGGITQSVKVYKVKISEGELLIIDTPGHEAFSSMRQVGAKITDIAVIIIAADDGLMPQTIESITIAKEMGATIVVAINKVDKDGIEANIDKIKRQLAQHDVLVEDWGGLVVCVPISAKTGKGVADLLEMILLQAELMNLQATADLDAKAFVVESFVERGQGPCAAVILKQGILNIGDDFVVDSSSVGRVKALFDVNGKSIKKLLPYNAAKIVGLSNVSKTGAFLEFLPRSLANKTRNLYADISHAENVSNSQDNVDCGENRIPLKIILKADGYGTASGLDRAVRLMMSKNPKFKGMVNIISTSIGNIYEKDVLAAMENNALILGMDVILEKNAADLARHNKIQVLLESIIYRVVDRVEQMVIEKLKATKELKQLGKGFVKKVFDIKGRGVIAGCAIVEGSFADKTVVQCFRDGVKVGEARVVSLQQDKRIMKEVFAGQDCGILCHGFSDWHEGDKVTCFSEVSVY